MKPDPLPLTRCGGCCCKRSSNAGGSARPSRECSAIVRSTKIVTTAGVTRSAMSEKPACGRASSWTGVGSTTFSVRGGYSARRAMLGGVRSSRAAIPSPMANATAAVSSRFNLVRNASFIAIPVPCLRSDAASVGSPRQVGYLYYRSGAPWVPPVPEYSSLRHAGTVPGCPAA